MENHVSTQALSLGVSVILGLCAAFLYDLFRSARLRRRRSHPLTHLLDGAFILCLGLLLLWLAVVIGQGRLRLYMLLGCGCGTLLWWSWPGRLLRPVWSFWFDIAAALAHWLFLPIRQLKKLFSFFVSWSIMRQTRRKELRKLAQEKRKKTQTHS